jgi:hypothetical protein
MSAGTATTLRSGELGLAFALHGHSIRTLLAQDHAAAVAEATLRAYLDDTHNAIPAAAVAHTRIVWAMRPPAAHSAALHTLTGTQV